MYKHINIFKPDEHIIYYKTPIIHNINQINHKSSEIYKTLSSGLFRSSKTQSKLKTFGWPLCAIFGKEVQLKGYSNSSKGGPTLIQFPP